VQDVLQALFEKGELYKEKYSGYYSIRQEQFLTDKDRDAEGEFGPEWGEVILLEEENWYFPLAKHKAWLKQFVEGRADFVIPDFRRLELLNAFLGNRISIRSGIRDLCLVRRAA
jgi:methionyl-tRNA synthetase